MRSPFHNHLRQAAVIGGLGGIFLTFYDTVTTVWRGDVRLFILGDLLRIFFLPLIIYCIAGVLVMVTAGTLFSWLYRANRLADTPNAHRGFQSGVFTFLASLYVLIDLLNARSDAKPLSAYWEILLISLLVSIGIGAAVMLVMRSVRRTSVRVLIYCAPILLLVLLAAGDLIRAKQLPRAFFTLQHKPRITTAKKTGTAAADVANRPNILWIVLDTVRADHLSAYGYNRATTPNIDALAKEGTLYANAMTVAPWTLPSHAAMLTGLFPSTNGADGAWPWLDDSFMTLPEVLKDRGYQTYGFSNNDNFGAMSNEQQGFDSFTLFTRSASLQGQLLLARTIRSFLFTVRAQGNAFGLVSLYRWLTDENPRKDYGASQTVAAAVQSIDAARSAGAPFFAFANFMEAHDPYGDSPDGGLYLKELGSPMGLTAARAKEDIIGDDVHAYIAQKQTLSDDDRRLITALYDGDLHYLDARVGEIVQALRDRTILDNTLLIVTSDHGENLGDHGLIDHVYDIHRAITHIPLIVRYPASFSPGTTVNELVESIDLFPTVLDVAGVTDWSRKDLQGFSLLGKERHPFAVSEAQYVNDTFTRTRYIMPLFRGVDERLFGGAWKALEEGDFAYIETAQGRMLYNVKDDPGETRNLIKENPRKAADLRAKLLQWIRTTPNHWNTLAQP